MILVERPQLRVVASAVGGFALLAATAASAFESNEHSEVSNTALCIVRKHVEAISGDPEDHGYSEPEGLERVRLDEVRVALEKLEDSPLGPHYGLLAMFPDYAAYPEGGAATDKEGFDRIDWEKLRDAPDFWSMVGELIRNPHHFRAAGLGRFHAMHAAAVDKARRRNHDGLWDAIAFNGHADHFLQDFFAPGHMTEDDFSRSSVETARAHDRDNRLGRCFVVHEKQTKRLRDLLPKESAIAEEVYEGCSEAVANDALPRQDTSAVRGDCREQAESLRHECLGRASRPPSDSEDAECGEVAVAAERCCLSLELSKRTEDWSLFEQMDRIGLKGDHAMLASDGKVLRPEQFAFMSLVSARSLMDVVAAYVWNEEQVDDVTTGPEPDDDGPECVGFNCFPDRRCPKPTKLEGPCPENPPPGFPWPFIDLNAKGVPQRELPEGCYFTCEGDLAPNSYAGIATGFYQYRELGAFEAAGPLPVIAATVTVPRLNEGSRKDLRVEFVLPVLPRDFGNKMIRRILDTTPVGYMIDPEHAVVDLGLGYTYAFGNDYQGHGPDVSLYLRMKKAYMFVAADMGYRFYKGNGFTDDNFRPGGRIGLEVGPLMVHVGLSRDQSIEDDGGKIDNTSWGFGITVMGSLHSLLSRL